MKDIKIAVVGLGYVGLPLALAFSRKFPGTVGFDINESKVAALNRGIDVTDEGLESELKSTALTMSADPAVLRGANFLVVGVPTPVDINHAPDLEPLLSASELVGKNLSAGATVVFESTVYPGLTEEICGPAIERASGLRCGVDFKLGYSPERINPGDKEHRLETIVKVVSGEDAETLDLVARVYGSVVTAGIHRAPSIRVAEAAKVIENTQRDLNIALMNELSIIFDRLQISTRDVLEAAGTKWNFLKFTPGLVGGHCIGVDPYYLTTKAEQAGYHPEVILAGRRINDGMGAFIAQRTVKLLVNAQLPIKDAKVGVLGLTFKENVTDLRNSRVPDIVKELREFGIQALVYDPMIKAHDAEEEYGIALSQRDSLRDLDALIYAVPHRVFAEAGAAEIAGMIRNGGILIDVKSALRRTEVPDSITYWSL